jgi:hypothetical protein
MHVALGGLVVSVLAAGPKVHGFDPDRGRWIRNTTSFGGEVKPSVPCRRFTACKRNLRAWIEMFRKQHSAAISHPSLLTACQMALAVISGLSRTCAVSGLVTHYINAHDHKNLQKEAPMFHVGATGTDKQQQQYPRIIWQVVSLATSHTSRDSNRGLSYTSQHSQLRILKGLFFWVWMFSQGCSREFSFSGMWHCVTG